MNNFDHVPRATKKDLFPPLKHVVLTFDLALVYSVLTVVKKTMVLKNYLLNIPLRMLDEPSEFEDDEVVVDLLFCFPNLGLPEVEGLAITPLLPVQVGNPDSALKHCLRDSLRQKICLK